MSSKNFENSRLSSSIWGERWLGRWLVSCACSSACCGCCCWFSVNEKQKNLVSYGCNTRCLSVCEVFKLIHDQYIHMYTYMHIIYSLWPCTKPAWLWVYIVGTNWYLLDFAFICCCCYCASLSQSVIEFIIPPLCLFWHVFYGNVRHAEIMQQLVSQDRCLAPVGS